MAKPKPKIGTFEDLLGITNDELKPTAVRLRQMVLDVHPETCEVVRLGERAATYGVGPKKMSEGYAYILPHANWLNFGFYKGALLEDPAGLLEGTGAKMRHVKVRTVKDAENPELKRLVKQMALAPAPTVSSLNSCRKGQPLKLHKCQLLQ